MVGEHLPVLGEELLLAHLHHQGVELGHGEPLEQGAEGGEIGAVDPGGDLFRRRQGAWRREPGGARGRAAAGAGFSGGGGAGASGAELTSVGSLIVPPVWAP